MTEFDAKRRKFKHDWFGFARFLSVSPFGEQRLHQELAHQGMRRSDLHRAVTLDVKLENVRDRQ